MNEDNLIAGSNVALTDGYWLARNQHQEAYALVQSGDAVDMAAALAIVRA